MAATRFGSVPSPTLFATLASCFGFFAVEAMTALGGFAGFAGLLFFAAFFFGGIALRVYQSVAQALLPVQTSTSGCIDPLGSGALFRISERGVVASKPRYLGNDRGYRWPNSQSCLKPAWAQTGVFVLLHLRLTVTLIAESK